MTPTYRPKAHSIHVHLVPPAGGVRAGKCIAWVARLATLSSLLACDDGPAARADAGSDVPADAGADQGPPDLGLLDQGPIPDEGPYDPYEAAGVFENIPGPMCVNVQVPREDLPADFEPMPFGPGTLLYAGDANGNGKAELFVYNFFIHEPTDPDRRQRGITIFEHDGSNWAEVGKMRSLNVRGFFDLEGDGRAELVGVEEHLAQLRPDGSAAGHGFTLGVRRDDPNSEWRYDERVALYVREVSEGFWGDTLYGTTAYNAADLDQDGLPEVVMGEINRIDEWNGSEFVQVFQATDPLFGLSGGGTGQVVWGDFDGDGFTEMVLPTYGPERETENGLAYFDQHRRVMEVRGDNTYVDTARLALGMPIAVLAAVGDLTGDGKDDLLIGGSPGVCVRYQLWTTAGDDRFKLLWEYDLVNDDGFVDILDAVAFGDVDGDGDDEAIMNMNRVLTVWDWVPDEMAEHGGRMVQIYGERVSARNSVWQPVFAADLDGDGKDEVMSQDPQGCYLASPTVAPPVQPARLPPHEAP
jgi:hypothetical protein